MSQKRYSAEYWYFNRGEKDWDFRETDSLAEAVRFVTDHFHGHIVTYCRSSAHIYDRQRNREDLWNGNTPAETAVKRRLVGLCAESEAAAAIARSSPRPTNPATYAAC